MKNQNYKKVALPLVAAMLGLMSSPTWAASAGKLIAWGSNRFGQTNVPAGADFVAIATHAPSGHALALRSDGSLAGWGLNYGVDVLGSADIFYGQAVVPAGHNFKAIAVGALHSLALRIDGSLAGWGANEFLGHGNFTGQATVPLGNDFVAIAAGDFHSLALRANGSLVAWGDNSTGQTNVPAGNDFVAIASGDYHCLALKSNGSIVAWGQDDYEEVRNTPQGTNFVTLAGGTKYSLALKSDGSMVAWGGVGSSGVEAARAQPGTNFVAIAGGYNHSLALKSDGSMIAWGSNYGLEDLAGIYFGQAVPRAGSNFIAVAASDFLGLAIQKQPPAPARAGPRYQVVDLGSLGGPGYYQSFSGISANLLNNSGNVAAGLETAEHDSLCLNGGACLVSHGFFWNNGSLFDLGVLVAADIANFSQSFSMNEQNTCVGISTFNAIRSPDVPLFRATLWKFQGDAAPQMVDLGTLGGDQSLAQDINNRDQVVGWSLNQTNATINIWEDYPWPLITQQRAALWENGTNQDLGTLGGPSAWATHINDRGQIIGSSYTTNEASRPRMIEDISWSRPIAGFLWENGKMVDLGNLGGTYMLPTWINSQGEITGLISTPGDSALHPFLWAKQKLKDLGTLGGASGRPNAMNDLGEVVGRAGLPSGAHRAFLWRNGAMLNLGTLGANSQAWAINSKTQVIGTSGRTTTENRAFLWENNGPMQDLNDLVPAGSPHLAEGIAINDRGELLIGGLNERGLYLLIPLSTLASRLSVVPAGRKFVMEAQTVPGRTYRLESSSDLEHWTIVAPDFIAEHEATTWESEIGTLSLFYRLAGPLF